MSAKIQIPPKRCAWLVVWGSLLAGCAAPAPRPGPPAAPVTQSQNEIDSQPAVHEPLEFLKNNENGIE
ncbi:MAG: hypothetical protein AAF384_19410 [Pseudomonadota bacterium]